MVCTVLYSPAAFAIVLSYAPVQQQTLRQTVQTYNSTTVVRRTTAQKALPIIVELYYCTVEVVRHHGRNIECTTTKDKVG